jgi:hypothetical protein
MKKAAEDSAATHAHQLAFKLVANKHEVDDDHYQDGDNAEEYACG